MVALGNGRKGFAVLVLVTVQPQAVLADGLALNVAHLDIVRKFNKALQIQRVVGGCAAAAAAFNLERFNIIIQKLGRIHTISIAHKAACLLY